MSDMFPNYIFDNDIFCVQFNCQPHAIFNEVLSKDEIRNYMLDKSEYKSIFTTNNIIIQIFKHSEVIIMITKDGIITFNTNFVLYQKNNFLDNYQMVEKDYNFDKYFSMTIEQILDHCKLFLLYS